MAAPRGAAAALGGGAAAALPALLALLLVVAQVVAAVALGGGFRLRSVRQTVADRVICTYVLALALAQDFDCDLAVKSIRKAIKDTFDGQECVETDKKYLDKWTKSITDGVLKQCQDNCNCKYAGKCGRAGAARVRRLLANLVARTTTVVVCCCGMLDCHVNRRLRAASAAWPPRGAWPLTPLLLSARAQ